jgi:hypothetical protein
MSNVLLIIKLVINYDAYRLDFQDYSGIEGVVWMNTREDFRKALAALTEDSAYFARLQAARGPALGLP